MAPARAPCSIHINTRLYRNARDSWTIHRNLTMWHACENPDRCGRFGHVGVSASGPNAGTASCPPRVNHRRSALADGLAVLAASLCCLGRELVPAEHGEDWRECSAPPLRVERVVDPVAIPARAHHPRVSELAEMIGD